MQDTRSRSKQLVVLCSLIIISALIMFFVGKPMIDFVSNAEEFRLWVETKGWYGRIIFLAMLIFQVVFAFIPGGIFEIAGGYAFGAVEGTILSIIGTTLGSAIAFSIVKKYGLKFALIFFSKEKLDSVRFIHNKSKLYLLVFIAYIIPGTPKDLLCYVAGLTDIKLSKWLIISSLARIPAITFSTIGGNAVGTAKYSFAILIFAIILFAALIGIIVYRYINKEQD